MQTPVAAFGFMRSRPRAAPVFIPAAVGDVWQSRGTPAASACSGPLWPTRMVARVAFDTCLRGMLAVVECDGAELRGKRDDLRLRTLWQRHGRRLWRARWGRRSGRCLHGLGFRRRRRQGRGRDAGRRGRGRDRGRCRAPACGLGCGRRCRFGGHGRSRRPWRRTLRRGSWLRLGRRSGGGIVASAAARVERQRNDRKQQQEARRAHESIVSHALLVSSSPAISPATVVRTPHPSYSRGTRALIAVRIS